MKKIFVLVISVMLSPLFAEEVVSNSECQINFETNPVLIGDSFKGSWAGSGGDRCEIECDNGGAPMPVACNDSIDLVASNDLNNLTCSLNIYSASNELLNSCSDGLRVLKGQCVASENPDCNVNHELPIPTHWNASDEKVEFMASGQYSAYKANPVGDAAYDKDECYYVYNDHSLPDVENYVGSKYSTESFTDAKAVEWANKTCQLSGNAVTILHPENITGDYVGRGPVSDSCETQVIHMNQGNNSLYTVILPPNWSADAPAGTYPVVFNGFYDLNGNMLTIEGSPITRIVSKSAQNEKRGVIGLVWNGGGAWASRTMNEAAMHEFNEMIQHVAERYRANKNWIMTFGISRGAVTAFSIASNPYRHDYRVVFTAATAPAAIIGEMAEVSGPTYPAITNGAGWSTGLSNAWRDDFVYPTCAGKEDFAGLSGPEAHVKVLTGSSDYAEIDANRSLVSDIFVDGLLADKTQVYFEVTEKDFIAPFFQQVKYGAKLFSRGVPVEAVINVRHGHEYLRLNHQADAFFEVHQHIMDAVDIVTDPTFNLNGAVPNFINPGLSYYKVNRTTAKAEAFTPADGMFPFSADLPYVAYSGHTSLFAMTGQPGTKFRLAVIDALGNKTILAEDIIADNMVKKVEYTLDINIPDMVFTYDLEILKPGQTEWQKIPNNNTTTGEPAIVNIYAEYPNVSWSDIIKVQGGPTLPAHTATGWGLTEY